jgi:DNA-binding transcriptional LysR family regulator
MLETLRIKDIQIVHRLARVRSIRELSRQLNLDPQNLTKRIASIESLLGSKLVERSSSGIVLLNFGREVAERAEIILQQIDLMGPQENHKESLSLCSRGFLVDYFIENVMAEFSETFNQFQLHFLDHSPEHTERAARQGILDLVLSFDDILLGENWHKEFLFPVQWGFYVRSGHPLSQRNKVHSLEKFPLVSFCYLDEGKLLKKDLSKVIKNNSSSGHCAQNSRYSSKIIQNSDHVGYLPDISVLHEVRKGELVPIDLEYPTESRNLNLHVHLDKVTQNQLDFLVQKLKNVKQ